ncbi:MAG: ATP synthase F1 subunit gamma [Bdellovibrionaceae bacterium]|nr:ATP synthase F1 subunit gamma [Pseudobdellovibrionaceae bacterium]|tara:strand:- start:2695 stop:3591 length:897 start_codon:yes stop_codon:yes gene_type:complete
MSSLKDLKTRIGSVKNTQQTTKAMKMVSAAKLRRAQEAIIAFRPYANEVARLIQLTTILPQEEMSQSPLFESRDHIEDSEKKILVVAITSDRGLCGNSNSSVVKEVSQWTVKNQKRYQSVDFVTIGKKGNELLMRSFPEKVVHFQEFGPKTTFDLAKKLVSWVSKEFVEGRYDEVRLVYNEFKNALVQETQNQVFLPVSYTEVEVSDEPLKDELFLLKPSGAKLLERLREKYFDVELFKALLDAQASEHGSRMNAMENATKNAGEMIQKLTLEYNKKRQAGITSELLEIIAGAESQKG